MTADRLVEALGQRVDGPWVLLATAAGVPSAVARVEHALDGSALERKAHGPAGAPSEVQDNVEALAAWSANELARVARTWLPPAEIGADPWWVAAWQTALRHLAASGELAGQEPSFAPVRSEAALVLGNVASGSASWRRLSATARMRRVPYATLRADARRPLEESGITRQDLERCPRLFLRLLRGRAWLLDRAARGLLGEWLESVPAGDGLEAALVYEIAGELRLDRRSAAADRLADALPTMRDPRAAAPLAYTILGRWVAP